VTKSSSDFVDKRDFVTLSDGAGQDTAGRDNCESEPPGYVMIYEIL
jgi:hypothetical protein